MAAVHPHTPVIVGVGRYTQRARSIEAAESPLDLAVRTARLAAADAGAGDADAVLRSVRAVGVASMTLGPTTGGHLYSNPPRSVARRVGAPVAAAEEYMSSNGGHAAQSIVSFLAARVASGAVPCALATGGEAMATLMRAMAGGWAVRDGPQAKGARVLPWADHPGGAPGVVGASFEDSPQLTAHMGGMVNIATVVYPLLEQAFRVAEGAAPEEHRRRIAALWSAFSAVAAADPEHAWFPTARTPDEVAAPTKANRMVGYPYTKYMNAVLDVDQAASVLIMSVAHARASGVPEGRWVYLHGCGDADMPAVLERAELHRSQAMRAAGAAALAMARVRQADVRHYDLYSCFPVAVEVACREMGVPLDYGPGGGRLTLTGGLAYHGGPASNYAMHGIARMAARLRSDPGSYGLCTANGGWLSKQSVGIYSTRPYAGPWARADPASYQPDVPRVRVAAAPSGRGRVEAYTVMHGRDGPTYACVVGRMDDGSRFVANSPGGAGGAAVVRDLLRRDAVGARGSVTTPAAGGLTFFVPDGVRAEAADGGGGGGAPLPASDARLAELQQKGRAPSSRPARL